MRRNLEKLFTETTQMVMDGKGALMSFREDGRSHILEFPDLNDICEDRYQETRD